MTSKDPIESAPARTARTDEERFLDQSLRQFFGNIGKGGTYIFGSAGDYSHARYRVGPLRAFRSAVGVMSRHPSDTFSDPGLINFGSTWLNDPGIAAAIEADLLESHARDLFGTLDSVRSDVASVARFGHRVELASYYLYVAFDKADVEGIRFSPHRDFVRPKGGIGVWYTQLINATLNRYEDLKCALLFDWNPPKEVEPLTWGAFQALSEMTPAETQLRDLYVRAPVRAFHELAKHLDIVVEQLLAATELARELDTGPPDQATEADQVRLETAQEALLQKAGASLSLTEAAKRLGVTRQALHKRFGLGTALGLMRGSELVVPEAQFIIRAGKEKIVEGLADVVRLFDNSGAGRWSALQFLIESDPNLHGVPVEILKAGKREAVVQAARSFLGLDEE